MRTRRGNLQLRDVASPLALLLAPAVGLVSVAVVSAGRAGDDPREGGPPAVAPAPSVPAPGDVTHTMAGRPDDGVLQLAQAVEREITVTTAKGSVVWTASALSDHGLPVAAERAYRRAAAGVARTDPACELPWTLLAGIGRIESDHGRYAGARLGDDGVSRPRIIGLRLDGTGPVAAIRDTDDGRLDRDRVWDRAVGPMQFIPSTWRAAARDGDGDGRRSPHDLDDASAAAAGYLCAGPGSLRDPATQAAAIYRYNHDDYYVALVRAFETGYRTGVFVIPPSPDDGAPAPRRKARAHRDVDRWVVRAVSARTRDRATRPTATRPTATGPARPAPADPKPRPATPKPPAATPAAPKPAPKPSPTPAPAPSPTPEPDAPRQVRALLATCDGGWCLGGTLLDLGSLAASTAPAAGDYDGDGTTETNAAELEGLGGTEVTALVVTLPDGRLGVLELNGVRPA